jgi:hypothetical protein
MKKLRGTLTYANVAATLALVIAVAGGTTALAASKNTVTSASIKPNNVTAGDLAGIRVAHVSGEFKAFAACSRGERLVGGGGAAGSLGTSRPGNNGWYVEQGSALGGNQIISAYALCLKAKPGK